MSFNGKISSTPKPPENRSLARVEKVLPPPAKVNKMEPIQAPMRQPVVKVEKASAIVRPAPPSSAQVNIGPSPQPIAPSKIVDTTARPPAPPGAPAGSGDSTPFPAGLAPGGAIGQGQRVTVMPAAKPKPKADQLDFNASVPARTIVRTTAQCPRMFRGDDIVVTSGEGLLIQDILVGKKSQLPEGANGIPATSGNFSASPLKAGWLLDTLEIGQDLTFVLENLTDEAIQFSATIKGRCVE